SQIARAGDRAPLAVLLKHVRDVVQLILRFDAEQQRRGVGMVQEGRGGQRRFPARAPPGGEHLSGGGGEVGASRRLVGDGGESSQRWTFRGVGLRAMAARSAGQKTESEGASGMGRRICESIIAGTPLVTQAAVATDPRPTRGSRQYTPGRRTCAPCSASSYNA